MILHKITVFALNTILLFNSLLLFGQNEVEAIISTKSTVASVNVTRAYVGQPIALRCSISRPDLWGRITNDIYFSLENYGDFARYVIKPTKSGADNVTLFDFHSQYHFFSAVHQLENHSKQFYQISVTPARSFNLSYSCQMGNDRHFQIYSDEVQIVVLPREDEPSVPTIYSNVSQVQLGHPFTLTCSLAKTTFSPLNKSYLVVFYNSRDSLLARYEVDASGHSFLFTKEYTNISVHHGARSTFPNFDITVTERANPKLNYWCSLWADSAKQITNSVHWHPEGPFVDFSSTVNQREHRGNCSIVDFKNHTELSYQVQYFTNLGPNATSLLGYYSIEPNQVTEFTAEATMGLHWNLILNGGQKTYPTFEILATIKPGLTNASKYRWWCALSFSEPKQTGANNTRLIKSADLPL